MKTYTCPDCGKQATMSNVEWIKHRQYHMQHQPIMEFDCPRCGRTWQKRSPQDTAVSRVDNATHICPVCGNDEAFFQITHDGLLQPLTLWPLPTDYVEQMFNNYYETRRQFEKLAQMREAR